MTSEAQKNSGYPIPETWVTEETASYCIVIPAGEEFRKAAYSQLLMLGKWWKWKHNEGAGSTRAKESAETWRLLFEFNEDCGGLDMATQEDIAKGMYQAFNWLALQIASGTYSNLNIVTDGDGVVTIPPEGSNGVDLPEDDPTTIIDESQSAKMGGSIGVLKGIEKYLDRIDNYYGATNGTFVTPAATTTAQLALLFPVDETLLAAAVTEYYGYRATENRFLYDSTPTHQNYMFCKGSNQAAWNSLLVELSGFNAYKMATVAQLTDALAPEFWTSYFANGSELPSTQYLDASCVPMPYQEFLAIPYASARGLSPSPAKGGHRLKIRVEGYYTDPDGDIQDAFWYRTSAGVLTRSNFTFTHSAGNNMPSDSQVPYSASHAYEYTIDLANAVSNWSVQFNRNANMNVASTSPTNGFSIFITDLGEYGV